MITNCTPNHLDWHGSWDAYVAAKRRALEMLPTGGFAVVDPTDWRSALVDSWDARVLVPAWPLERLARRAPGEHNRRNAALAAAAAEHWGVAGPTIERM